MKSFRLSAALLGSASVLAFAASASAQTQDTATAVDEVVVTGSRVIANGDNSPTPVTVVRAQDLLSLQPTTVADALNALPVFAGQKTQVSNPNTGSGNGGGGNAAANQLNLRNMGSARTLILFDGHRVAPTTASGIVDVDMIPQLLLQRVDIVTGGASAVYGSDAITGVVNFITERNFEGVKVNLRAGVSGEGDGEQYEAGVAFGKRLSERAHFEASYEFRNDEGILWRSSRPGLHLWTVQGNGSQNNPFFLTDNTRRADATFGGLVRSGVLSGQQFATNGVLTPFVSGQATGVAATQIGGDGAYFDGSLKAPLRSHQLFGRFDYDLTDKIHAYVEVAANNKRNEVYANWQQLTNVTLSAQNAFLARAYKAQLATANQSTFTLGKFITNAPRLNPRIEENQVFLNAGLEGKFGGGYKWSLGYVHSSAELLNTEANNLNNRRLSAALDAVVNPANGQTVCNVTLTNPGLYPGCVPLNPFGPTSESPEAIAYVLGDTHFDAYTLQDDITGSISGSPFSTWAGPVAVALSGEWRRQSYRAKSDATPSDVGNCTGLRYNCTASTAQWYQTFANRSRVSQTVYEGALEFDAPLLVDAPFAKSLNLNGAVRYTNYDTSGAYTTWKIGVDWHLNDELRFRATRSKDIRAPTLDDLFAPAVSFPVTVNDLLLNATSSSTTLQTGNPDLKAEIGETTTAGLVYRPDWAPRFSLALDAFDIRVTDAINSIQGNNATVQRACYASGGASPYCALQVRPLGFSNTTSANAVTRWMTTVINIADVHTWGADLEANYATSLAGRPLKLRGLVTYQPHAKYATPGLPTLDMGGVAYGASGLQASPVWRMTAFVQYSPVDNLTIDLMQRWRSALDLTADPTVYTTGSGTKSVGYTNVNLTYKIKQGPADIDLFFNVQNLFDTDPPPANFNGTQTSVGLFGGFAIGDDPVGRYFATGARLRF